MTLGRERFRASDPEVFCARIAAATPNPPHVDPLGARFRAEVELVSAPRASLLSLHTEARITDPNGASVVGINVPLAGRFRFRRGRRSVEVAPGRAFVRRPGDSFDMATSDASSLLVVHLREPLLTSRELDPGRAPRLEILSLETAEGRRFLRSLRFVWEEIRSGALLSRSPLAVGQLEDLLLVSFLAIAEPEDDGAATAGGALCLAQAEAYLASRIGEPVSVADVARVIGVSPRTLSRRFKERHGMGAIAFLRQRRLEAAHRELRANRAGETSVTEVALRCGFAHLGRFPAEYRRRFGELPSETLAQAARSPRAAPCQKA